MLKIGLIELLVSLPAAQARGSRNHEVTPVVVDGDLPVDDTRLELQDTRVLSVAAKQELRGRPWAYLKKHVIEEQNVNVSGLGRHRRQT